ncbi:MAG: TolC family protein [Bacteroidaceae bacterium]|nr:TolC family protein [Bacteroidaceae bacterium]
MNSRIILLYLIAILTATLVSAQNNVKIEIEQMPERWMQEGMFEQTSPIEDNWWRRFNDPQLDSLINLAVERNYSVISAIENMRIAKAVWKETRAGLLPSLDLNIGWQRTKTSGNSPTSGYREEWEGYYNTAAEFSWEIDVFGKIYKKSLSQKELYLASEEEYRAVMISLCANVAITYFSIKQSIARLTVLQQNAVSQNEIKNLVEARYNSGLASKLDLAQARSVYYSTIASIPQMESTIENYRNTLAVLLATYPSRLQQWHTDGNLPEYIDPVAVGLPAMLLLRRPDVRSAEREIEAYALQLGASKREWLPSFYINGSIGFSSENIEKLPRSNSMQWQVAPSLSWNIFDGGSTGNATKQAQARLDKSIADFNSTLLKAIQEVENAMSEYKNSIKQIVALAEAVNYSRETLQLSLDLYKQGLTQFQNVLDSQRTLLNYQEYLVQAQGNSLITLVQLYEALGGGW